jgi:hypothetical protein
MGEYSSMTIQAGAQPITKLPDGWFEANLIEMRYAAAV